VQGDEEAFTALLKEKDLAVSTTQYYETPDLI
jgi:hypothetical protein